MTLLYDRTFPPRSKEVQDDFGADLNDSKEPLRKFNYNATLSEMGTQEEEDLEGLERENEIAIRCGTQSTMNKPEENLKQSFIIKQKPQTAEGGKRAMTQGGRRRRIIQAANMPILSQPVS